MNRFFPALLLTLLTFNLPAQAQSTCCRDTLGDVSLNVEVIASGLNRPWGLAFLPDGSQLVTERGGRLRHIQNGRVSGAIQGLPSDLASIEQGGLLDILVHPNFAQNNLIFFTYTQRSSSRYGTAVARAELDVSNRRLRNLQTIFTMNQKSSGGRHFGSRLVLGNDGTLFVTLGDRGDPSRAQDPFDHAGKVIRINQDGSIPHNNPFADGSRGLPEIWSLGHRNAQGATLHPRTGDLWTIAHGPAGGDEVNRVLRGRNYGWPRISYGENYDGTGFSQGSAASGLEQPRYYWDPSVAPSGLTYYNPSNALIPAWRGAFLHGALRGQYLGVLDTQGNRIRGSEIYLNGQYGRIRDVRTGPNGAVWVLTDSSQGQLLRLTQG
ncbi:MAG: PQQ-dependent sugar dehydrogenase [Pseudomonadota bacterium]